MHHDKRKTVKHVHEPGDFHELTFSCYHTMPLLNRDDWRRRLSPHIDRACRELAFELVAFVYMLEHVHLLVNPQLPDPRVDRMLARLKQPYSIEIKKLLMANRSLLLRRLTVRERPGKNCFRFWQEGAGYDRNINTARALRASIDYIHMNPVRRGLGCCKVGIWTALAPIRSDWFCFGGFCSDCQSSAARTTRIR